MRIIVFYWLFIFSVSVLSKEHLVKIYKKEFIPAQITIE